jgi:hypothetical protein
MNASWSNSGHEATAFEQKDVTASLNLSGIEINAYT